MRRLVLPLLAVISAPACGGDDDTGGPDARPRPDAADHDAMPTPLCINQTDEACGYTPEPVTPADYTLAEQQALAERFNPAMVYTHPDIWAVSVDLLLVHGTEGLMVAPHDGRLNFSYDVDETKGAVTIVSPQPDLLNDDWHDLPTTDSGSGRGLVYFLDFPGNNLGNHYTEETWTAAWVGIQGDTPTAAPFPPLQYAHLFWLDKAERLLAIQYWFFYPYDKFTNNHEGDWEHVNVVLRAPEGGEPTFGMAQFSFHGRQLGVDGADLYRVTGDDGGDHLVVFVGGDACLNYLPDCWCGTASGGSFPYPGRYDLGYREDVAGTTAAPGRAIPAGDFTIQLLPRLEDVDYAATPNLSWYGLPMIFGDPTIEANAPAVIATENHRAPVGPGPAHDEYDVGIEQPDDALPISGPQPFDPPDGAAWTLVNEPPSTVFVEPPPRNACTPDPT